MSKKDHLRPVEEDERAQEPLSLLEAIESGSVLEMLMAQRRLIGEALIAASENTRPQFNNELNKLHKLIAEEQKREKVAAEEGAESVGVSHDEVFDPQAV